MTGLESTDSGRFVPINEVRVVSKRRHVRSGSAD
jgi:hypothetical protein